MGALLQTPILARLVSRLRGRSTKPKPEPEWRIRYRQLYGRDPPPWRLGNGREAVINWAREFRARKGRKPSLPEVQQVFRLPKTTAWRRVRDA